jgi:hypothetical protein
MDEDKWYVVGVTVIDQHGNVLAMCDTTQRGDLIVYEHNKAIELRSENARFRKQNEELNTLLEQALGRVAELEKTGD